MYFDLALDELGTYDLVATDERGEIETYDKQILVNIIRRRELQLILNNIPSKTQLLLDYGCGSGWLSKILSSAGFEVVGIDLNAKLVKKAKIICSNVRFVVCHTEKLPFRDGTFDAVVGVAILHHINVMHARWDLKRVLSEASRFVFLEPNSLNPFSAIGRRFFPTEAHTEGERTFLPYNFKRTLQEIGFSLERFFTLFFITFPLARLFKVTKIKPWLKLVRLIDLFEGVIEQMPGLAQLNSTIVAIGYVSTKSI